MTDNIGESDDHAPAHAKTWAAWGPATVGEIGKLVGGHTNGKAHVLITGMSGIREAREGDITFVADPRYLPLIEQTKASAIIVSKDLEVDETENSPAFIRVDDPGAAFAQIAEHFTRGEMAFEPGVHPAAFIGKGVSLGRDVTIQAYAVICDGAVIGAKTVIYPGVYVGHYTRIGARCLIYPGVKIRERITIGNNVIIHSNAVIGSDGYGYTTIDGVHHKIPHVGTVEIEDDVEIGANVTIDRARFGRTHVGKGTKIDNLVMIAHNAWVGERCLLIGQSGIAGSTHLGSNVVIAAQAGLTGHLEIGDNVVIGGRAGVTKSIPSNTKVSGFPAQNHDRERREQVYLRKLPEYCARIKELGERLSHLEEAAKNRSQ